MLPSLFAIVKPYNDTSGRPARVLAHVELQIAGAFAIKGIRILSKKPGDAFIVFPAEKNKGRETQEWFDIAHPLTAEARGACLRLILAEYAKVVQRNPYHRTPQNGEPNERL